MTTYRVSDHARQKYMIRTCRTFVETIIDLSTGIENSEALTYNEAKEQGFKVIKDIKGNTYHTWLDTKTNEPLLAIIRDNMVVTVQTKDLYSLARRKKKIRGLEEVACRGMDFYKNRRTIK